MHKGASAILAVSALSVIGCLSGCTGMPGNAPAAPADQVKVFSNASLPTVGFELVARLGVGSYWSALDLPQYDSPEQGIEDMRRQAAKLGANGLMNPACVIDPNRWFMKPTYFCTGNAIRVKST
jgi:hypothetical protein